MQGNIDKVLRTITDLIEKLNSIDNLPNLLLSKDFESIGNENYFSSFNICTSEGYVGNNFGQDLRNFKRFLEFAKESGTTTVWFNYGWLKATHNRGFAKLGLKASSKFRNFH